ncbi:MAG: hypothetical protein WBA52_02840 [Dolichospermum sp.]
MTGRSLTASIEGIEKAKKALGSNSLNQTALARELGLSRSTVTNFFRQIPIERLNFEEICTKLGLDWQDIVDITANETEIEEIENPIFKDPNFLGREEDIANINNLVNEGKKVILIKAEGGIGKTTLAENWFKIQGLDYLKLNVGTTSQTLKSVEEWVISQLRETFKVTPVQNFGNILDQLTTQLQKRKIGILIDNLEPVLKNGEFIELHKSYIDLLEILANQNIQGITIITSREQIYEHKIFRLSTFHNYDLEGLNEKTWKEYFENKKIIIDNDSLNAMWRNYGGNAEAMSLLAADILNESNGNLKAYWQDNSEDLLRHRSLEQLVKSQFDKLKNDNSQAYNLLCRLGVYPNQDINLPKIWLECLLWDVPENKRKRVIDDLLSHCLLKKRDEGYYLHPVIRVEATERCNFIDERHDTNLISIKLQVDLLVASSHKFQNFLEWLYTKFRFTSPKYVNAAFRAFYLGFVVCYNFDTNKFIIDNEYEFCELSCCLDESFNLAYKHSKMATDYVLEEVTDILNSLTLDKFIKNSNILINSMLEQDIYEDSIIDEAIYKFIYEVAKEVIDENIDNLYEMLIDFKKYILENTLFLRNEIDTEIFIFTYFDNNTIINMIAYSKINQLRKYINETAKERIENIVFQHRKEEYRHSLYSYQKALIAGKSIKNTTSNFQCLKREWIQKDKWQFNEYEMNKLKNYYHANKFLAYCLHLTSLEVRSYIEETLLLPIEEIEKRPFKYQE